MRFSKPTMIAATVLIVLIGAVSLGWTYYGAPDKSSDQIILLGNIDVRQVNLAFKVAGRMAAANVEEGDAVKAGQTVASLEVQDFEDEVRMARARVEGQKALVAELNSGTRPEELEQARALVTQRQAELKLARATLTRQQELAVRNVASHQIHDEAQTRLDEAQAQLLVAQKSLELAELGPRDEKIQQAKAQLNADQAALSLAERRLADATIKTPNAGVIMTRVREPGAIVAAGETIYTLTLNSTVWVRTYVDEPDLGHIRAGMPAEVSTDSGAIYTGQVGFVSPVAEFTPKTVETRNLRTSLVYRLRVIVEDPDDGLRQGMPVSVVLRPSDER